MNDPSASQKWGNVIAREQLLSGARQEKHLQQLNQQLGALRGLQQQQLQAQLAWQQQQQWQALLQQVLYDTEENAKMLFAAAKVDPFTAAVRARLWLWSISDAGVNPSQYAAVEHKRALTEAGGFLEGIARGDVARSGNLVDRFAAAWRQHDELRRRLGDASDARVEALQQIELDAEAAMAGLTPKARTATVIALLSAAAAFLCLVPFAMQAGDTPENSSLKSVGAIGFLVCAAIAAGAWLVQSSTTSMVERLRPQAAQAGSHGAAMKAALAGYRAFLADANGGQLLEQVMREHPALAG